jgi:cytochrome c-type biogenesis protein CcmH
MKLAPAPPPGPARGPRRPADGRGHALGALVALLVLAACGDARPTEVAAAKRIEGRLYAPCCWKQTLDIHASPLADELRAEIARRSAAGEAEAAIEDDLAHRYGERIRAAPTRFDPDGVAWGLAGFAGLGGVFVWWWARRRRVETAAPAPSPPSPRDEALNDRLDDELRELD